MKFVPEHLQKHFEEVCNKYSINTPLRKAHFLAQVTHECVDFKVKEENLNYSAEGLQAVFKKYFPDKATAITYARHPEAIASRVYANRLGNGDESSREGWKYRGRGFMQVTGKENYQKASTVFGEDFVNNPELLTQDKYAMLSAGWFWDKAKLNLVADKGTSEEVVKAITKVVNGGFNGLDDRIKRFNNIIKGLS
jgi:putative chitinase